MNSSNLAGRVSLNERELFRLELVEQSLWLRNSSSSSGGIFLLPPTSGKGTTSALQNRKNAADPGKSDHEIEELVLNKLLM
jgi:hypothetical protein